jgi:hypothetical protein
LFIHIHMVCTSFITCQINERYFTKQFFAIFKRYLKYGVWTGGISICWILWCNPFFTSLSEIVAKLLAWWDAGFLQSDYIDVIFVILAKL